MTAPEPCAPNARPLGRLGTTTLGEQRDVKDSNATACPAFLLSFPPPWGGGSFEGVQVSATVPLESCLDLVLGGPHRDPLDVEDLGGGHGQGGKATLAAHPPLLSFVYTTSQVRHRGRLFVCARIPCLHGKGERPWGGRRAISCSSPAAREGAVHLARPGRCWPNTS